MADAASPLTASRDTRESPGEIIAYLMKASETIYKGALVSIAGATGLAQAFTDSAAGEFVGIAYEKIVSAASGSYYIRVYKRGVHRLTWYDDNAVAQADVGDELYGLSSAEVCPNASGSGATNKVAQNIKVGKLAGFDGTVPLVRIDGYT